MKDVKSNNYWTYDRCKNEALKYNTKKEFCLNSSGAYSNAKRNNWIENICGHMKKLKKPKNYWTYEMCKEIAIDCESKMELYKKHRGVYTTINKHKWFELISHFIQ